MQVWKFSGSLDFMEIWMTATFDLKHSKVSRRTSYDQQLLYRVHSDVMGAFMEGYWKKNTASFSSTRCQERLLSRHRNRDLRLRPPRWSSLRRSSVGLKHHWSIWGTMEPKTTKRKCCKTFYDKRESVMRLPKDTALNQMDWMRNSTSRSWTRFAECLSMQTWLRSSGLLLHIMQSSSSIAPFILPSITTRVQMALMETHPIFWSSTSSVVSVMPSNFKASTSAGVKISKRTLSWN